MEYNQQNMFSSFPDGINPNMKIATPTYDQITIKPPDKNKTHGKKTTRLIVDSREREIDLYPDPSKYTLELEHEERDVVSVELSQANIPNSFYNIYHYEDNGILYANNIIHLHLIVNGNDMSRIFELPVGKYKNYNILEEQLQILVNNINIYTSPYFEIGSKIINSAILINTLTSKLEFIIIPNQNNFKDVDSFYFEFIEKTNCTTLNIPTKNKKYPKYSIGSILGFNKKNAGEFKGTISCNNGDVNIYGNLTDFINDFSNCDKYPKIIVQSQIDTYGISVPGSTPLEVERVVSNNHIILKNPYTGLSFSNKKFYPLTIISPNVIELDCDKYIILDIRELHRLKSNTDTIEDRFAIIPIDYLKCSTKLNIGTIPTQREIKYFNPPHSRLSKMNIAFYRYNGDPLHFNGVNHILDFNITALNQASKYNDINSGTINN